MSRAALELSLPPQHLSALLRLPFLAPSSRAVPAEIVWFDTADGGLAARGEALSESGGGWRRERLEPGALPWPPMTPAPLLAEGASAEACGVAPHLKLGAIAGFRGTRRSVPALDGIDAGLLVLNGTLHGVSADCAVCRLFLDGEAGDLRGLALRLAAVVPVSVPRAALGAEAIAIARGQEPPPRHLGAPALQPGWALSDSMAAIIGQLLDVMLHWSEGAAAGATPVPVHQMRVATRRLRSALSVFKAVSGPAVASLGPALRDTAARLGAARDWDVFLEGTGARIQAAFPEDRRVAALVAAARRKRAEAYDALRAHLSGTEFRELQVALGCAAALRPWDAEGHGAFGEDTAPFAAAMLTRRLRTVRRAGRGLANLPVPALHELRKDCKRLRYAAEFFQPLFPERPARRFVKHLSALQEELGMLNDGAMATGLLAHLGRAERGYAAGVVIGFVTASAAWARPRIGTAWKQFKRQDPFWA